MDRFLSVSLAIVANMCSARRVHRTARITCAPPRPCYGLLRSAGDAYNRALRVWHCPRCRTYPLRQDPSCIRPVRHSES
jgi:hypothetical protein